MIILNFFIGASLASFVNLVVIRKCRNESIVWPRSHCDTCGNQLGAIDLIPVLSYIILIGKCRQCKQHIPISSFLVEILLGVAFASTPLQIKALTFLGSILILTYLSLFDHRTQLIPTTGICLLFASCFVESNQPLSHIIVAIFIYLGVQLVNRKQFFVGSGDIDILFCLWLASTINLLLWTICLACVFATFYLIIAPWPKENKIPFVPFLTMGYFIAYRFSDFLSVYPTTIAF